MNKFYLCKLTLDKEILQSPAIYRIHNNIKSIGVECIGICSQYSIMLNTVDIQYKCYKNGRCNIQYNTNSIQML